MRLITKTVFALALVFTLSACGYGSVAHTATMSPAGSGKDVAVGDMRVQEILVITDGTNSVLTAVLINTSDTAETLVGASVDRRLVQLVDNSSGIPEAASSLVIPPNSSVSLSFTAPYGAVLESTTEGAPMPGSAAKVEFSFANNGFVKAEALVFENSDMYAEVNPTQFILAN